jgi:hypothetical protein
MIAIHHHEAFPGLLKISARLAGRTAPHDFRQSSPGGARAPGWLPLEQHEVTIPDAQRIRRVQNQPP